jgi:lipoate---protein ligase
MDKWRVIRTIEDNAYMQMAIDESILNQRINRKIPNTLRFYRWNPVAVSVGYFQSVEKEIDINSLTNLNIDLVRRYTGGGAVLHDNELTYSVVLNEDKDLNDIHKSYEKICQGIIEGLKELGIESEFKPINDILVNGKKISGNAQTRKNGVILQHGTILIDVDVKKMFSVLKVSDEKMRYKIIETVEDNVTSIKNEKKKDLDIRDIENAIIKGFQKVFDFDYYDGVLSVDEINLAKEICKNKYSTKEWIYKR